MRELDVFHCPLDGVHLIEASAGTGKTWNICGLYLRLLLEQQRTVEEILVVTFTKAATAELRERIRSRLAELLRALKTGETVGADPFIGDLRQALQDNGQVDLAAAEQCLQIALESFDAAAIFTIHGFCQRALAETPFAASEPFQFEFLADDTALRQQTAADFWRQHISHADLNAGFAAHLVDSDFGPDWLAEHLGRRLKKPLAALLWPPFPASFAPQSPDLAQAFASAKALWQADSQAIIDLILYSLICRNT